MSENRDTKTGTSGQDGMAPNTGCEMTDHFLTLANEAWCELLKEKMKAELQKTCGAKFDGLAKFLVEGNGERMSAMITGKAKCEQFKADLAKLMAEGASQK